MWMGAVGSVFGDGNNPPDPDKALSDFRAAGGVLLFSTLSVRRLPISLGLVVCRHRSSGF